MKAISECSWISTREAGVGSRARGSPVSITGYGPQSMHGAGTEGHGTTVVLAELAADNWLHSWNQDKFFLGEHATAYHRVHHTGGCILVHPGSPWSFFLLQPIVYGGWAIRKAAVLGGVIEKGRAGV